MSHLPRTPQTSNGERRSRNAAAGHRRTRMVRRLARVASATVVIALAGATLLAGCGGSDPAAPRTFALWSSAFAGDPSALCSSVNTDILDRANVTEVVPSMEGPTPNPENQFGAVDVKCTWRGLSFLQVSASQFPSEINLQSSKADDASRFEDEVRAAGGSIDEFQESDSGLRATVTIPVDGSDVRAANVCGVFAGNRELDVMAVASSPGQSPSLGLDETCVIASALLEVLGQ